jgi:LPXTG-motif cell wall-anchored protein
MGVTAIPRRKIMIKRITVILTAVLVAFLMGGSWAWATPPGNETKTGLCHRTASDSNPYVFIEVDDNSLQSHLTDTKGHFPKPWKSDGVFRSVSHVKGDLKHDYEATSAEDCVDNTPVQPDPVVETSTDSRMTCEVGVEEQTTTTTTEYVWEDGEWVLGEPVVEKGDWTFVRDLTKAEQKELGCENEPRPYTMSLKQTKSDCDGNYLRIVTITYLNDEIISKEKSKWVKVSDITKAQKSELECLTPIDEPTSPDKAQKPPKTNQPELPHTGGNLTLAGIAAGLLAAGSGMVWFSRRLTGV